MRIPSLGRTGLYGTVAVLSGVCLLTGWRLWHQGALEGEAAWMQGRVVALSVDKGTVESGLVPLKKQEAKKEISKPEVKVPEEASVAPPPATSNALLEKAKEGMLPIIAKDGTKPWEFYAKPFERNGKSPLIAIVITGLGQSKTPTEAAIGLPSDVTLGFSPYASNVAVWVEAARAKGHETLLELPMEPQGFPMIDPGPLALLTGNNAEENTHRLRQVLAKAAGPLGLIVPEGEVYTIPTPQVKLMAEELAARGVLLLSEHDGAATALGEAVKNAHLPYLQADMVIDSTLEAESIDRQLASLEEKALKNGYAIGISHSFPLSIGRLGKWAQGLSQRGFQLAPLSALARMQNS